MAGPLCIWRLSDGRRGHDNQSLGLVEALSRLVTVQCKEIAVAGAFSGALAALTRARPEQRPMLVVGAGHATHPALLLTAHRQRARSVVLMNPSIPRALFDLCIVPRHDGVAPGGNVLLSLGALNRIRPVIGRRDERAGLVLLGGPSRHYRWDELSLVDQLRAVLDASPQIRWEAATSPRTPASTVHALRQLAGLRLVEFRRTAATWLPERLAAATQVWVSADSVSMAYEAVSSGAATGILALPQKQRGRVHAAIQALIESSRATPFDAWAAGAPLQTPTPLEEADRCARSMLERWPDLV